MKLGTMTHFNPLKPSEGQKFDVRNKMADGRCPEKFATNILKAWHRTGRVRMLMGMHIGPTLANTTKPSVRGRGAALCQITLTICFLMI